MRRITKIYLLIFVGFISNACSSNNPKDTSKNSGTDSTAKPVAAAIKHHFRSFSTGEVINHIPCLQDTGETFCIYLPKDYDTTKSWPVVYFFDAHARGKLPVNKYKELAEAYKMVIIGSNSSQNGLQPDAYTTIANNLFATTQTILNLSPEINLVGFSGGGKVATGIALKNSAVVSVVSCGAGADMNDLGSSYFNCVTVVGKGDFNYWDMVAIDKQLDNKPLRHLFLSFDGIHEWPDSRTMNSGLSFALNPPKSNGPDKGNTVDTSLKQKETYMRNSYMKASQTQDATYWMNEIVKLNADMKKSKAEDQKWLDRRLLSFINMITYLRVSDELNNKRLGETGPYLNVFKASDPKNPDGPYLTADWYALNGDKQGAITALSEAMKLGYDDFAHFSTDPLLSSLQQERAYQDMYKALGR